MSESGFVLKCWEFVELSHGSAELMAENIVCTHSSGIIWLQIHVHLIYIIYFHILCLMHYMFACVDVYITIWNTSFYI